MPPPMSQDERVVAERYRRPGTDRREGLNVLGKIWNAPNTALGLTYGAAGHLAGMVMGRKPHIALEGNAIQFLNNPFGGVGAITLGNTTVWNGDPYDANNDPMDGEGKRAWHYPDGTPIMEGETHTYMEHEKQHTRQGELLGPLYLPSNILGGLYSLLRERKWHGDVNWNEKGPQMPQPQPWPPGK